MQTTRGELLYFCFIIALAILIYKDTLFYRYTGADFFAQIGGNYNIKDALAGPLSAEFLGDTWYRPVDAFTLYLNYKIGGLDPFVYQATNMVIFLFTITLLFIFVRQVFRNRKITFFSIFIFIFYPVTMMVLPVVTFRAEMLLAAFMLLTLIFLNKYLEEGKRIWQILAVISAFLTICSKEAGLVMMPLLVAFYIVVKNKNKDFTLRKLILSVTPYVGCIVFYFVLVFTLIGQYSAMGASATGRGLFYLIFDRLIVAAKFFGSLIYPMDIAGLNNINLLELDYLHATIPEGTSVSVGLGYILVGILGLILLLFLLRKIIKMKIKIRRLLDFKYLTSFFTKDSFILFWILIYFAFFVFYGKYQSYYSYIIIPAASIYIAKWYLKQKKSLKGNLKKIIVLVFIIYSVVTTPLIMSYSNYKTGSETEKELVPKIINQTKGIDDNSSFYFVNNYGGVLGEGYAAGIPSHSLNALLYLKHGDRNWTYSQVNQFVVKSGDKPYSVDYEVIKNNNSFEIKLTGKNVRFYKNPAKSCHPLGARKNVNVSGFLFPKESKQLSITFNKYNENHYIMLCYTNNSNIDVIVERIGDFLNKN